MRSPKRIPKDWRWRWVVTRSWGRLHRVSKLNLAQAERSNFIPIGAYGFTVCGLSGYLAMPGIFSRMSLERCKHCEKAMKLKHGRGNPFNAGIRDGR